MKKFYIFKKKISPHCRAIFMKLKRSKKPLKNKKPYDLLKSNQVALENSLLAKIFQNLTNFKFDKVFVLMKLFLMVPWSSLIELALKQRGNIYYFSEKHSKESRVVRVTRKYYIKTTSKSVTAKVKTMRVLC